MVSPLIAAKAYAAVQSQAVGGGPTAVQPAGSSFADVLQTVVTDAVHASRTAETQMAMHTQGKAELIDVVTAVSSAEASLETAMAIRDQVIAAYQEIMRMPI
jgi:flagellar hook-basal body complex protein FliE